MRFAAVQVKRTRDMTRILLVAEADDEVGFGHFYEIRAIAKCLKEMGGAPEILVMGNSPAGTLRGNASWHPDASTLAAEIESRFPAICVWSCRRPLPEILRKLFVKKGDLIGTVWLADQPDSPPSVDLFVVPSAVQRWHVKPPAASKTFFGPDYFPLDPAFMADPPAVLERTEDVLLSLGGSDRTQTTTRLIDALEGLKAAVVIGPGFRHRDEVRRRAERFRVRVFDAPEGLHDLLISHRLVVSAGGNTLYEAAASGTPALVAWEDPHEEEQGYAFSAMGAALVLGQGISIDVREAGEKIRAVLRSEDGMTKMSRAGRMFVDGQGARRLAKEILLMDSSRAQQKSDRTPHIIPQSRPYMGQVELDAVARRIASRQLAQGPVVQELESEWCRHTSMRRSACVGSGLAAIRLSLLALEINPGDEVILPAYTCVALMNAVLSLGATPVLADIQPDEWTLSIEDATRRITSKTKALIVVHQFGLPAPIPDFVEMGIPVIEDCAHGIGGQSAGRPFGGIGALSVASFYATKMIAGGEGGIVAGNDPDRIDRIARARNYNDQEPNGLHLNDKMTDIEAAIALAQLQRLPEILRLRAERANLYHAMLSPLVKEGLLDLPLNPAGRIWYRYGVKLRRHLAAAVTRLMADCRIMADQPVWDLRRTKIWREDLKVTGEAFDRVLSLPIYPDLSREDQERVCRALAHCLKEDTNS